MHHDLDEGDRPRLRRFCGELESSCVSLIKKAACGAPALRLTEVIRPSHLTGCRTASEGFFTLHAIAGGGMVVLESAVLRAAL